jgi:hypothetical protein
MTPPEISVFARPRLRRTEPAVLCHAGISTETVRQRISIFRSREWPRRGIVRDRLGKACGARRDGPADSRALFPRHDDWHAWTATHGCASRPRSSVDRTFATAGSRNRIASKSRGASAPGHCRRRSDLHARRRRRGANGDCGARSP